MGNELNCTFVAKYLQRKTLKQETKLNDEGIATLTEFFEFPVTFKQIVYILYNDKKISIEKYKDILAEEFNFNESQVKLIYHDCEKFISHYDELFTEFYPKTFEASQNGVYNKLPQFEGYYLFDQKKITVLGTSKFNFNLISISEDESEIYYNIDFKIENIN